MIDSIFAVLSAVSISLGIIALLIGSLGLIRLPDVYCRIHAVGMMDTAGASLIILGMMFHAGFTLVSAKLALVGIFMFFTSPIATHAVAQIAYRMGVKPAGRTTGRIMDRFVADAKKTNKPPSKRTAS